MCICASGFSGTFCTTYTKNNETAASEIQQMNNDLRLIRSKGRLIQNQNDQARLFCSSSSSPCKNGGSCENGRCLCANNFTGPYCEISLTCDPNPCHNSSPCLEIDGVARCFCAKNFEPPFCD
jgi:hypothetical protein